MGLLVKTGLGGSARVLAYTAGHLSAMLVIMSSTGGVREREREREGNRRVRITGDVDLELESDRLIERESRLIGENGLDGRLDLGERS
jgi:hypothetical protein